MSMFHIVCQLLKILQCFNVLQICMEFTVVCNRVYLHKVYVRFDSLVMYIYIYMYISSHAINMYFPIVQNIRFCSQWWQPKDPKRMVFLLPFVGSPMDSQNKGCHQRCPSVEPCVRDGSWGGKPVLKTRVKPTPKLTERAWRMVLGKTMKNHPLSFGESESWHLKCYFWVTMLTLPFFGPCGSCGTTISQRLLLWKIKEYNLSHTQRILL